MYASRAGDGIMLIVCSISCSVGLASRTASTTAASSATAHTTAVTAWVQHVVRLRFVLHTQTDNLLYECMLS